MVGDPQNTSLGDVAKIRTGPFGSQLHAHDYTPLGVPVVMPTNIVNRRIDPSSIVRISQTDADRLSQHKLRLGDLVFSRRGEIDKCALVKPQNVGWLCGTGCLLARVNPKVALPAYIAFHISSLATRNWLNSNAVGLVMPNLNTGILERLPLRLPALEMQQAVSDILSALDDKIELNRQMAKTLEEMARALFKSWFVDFDPIRAKTESRSTRLPDDLDAVFPGTIADDGQPEGWTLQSIEEMFDVSGGNTPSTVEEGNWGGPHQWATPKDLSSLSSPVLLQTERQLTDAGLARSTSGLLPTGSLLLSSRAPIGYMAFATRPVAINQGFAGFVRKEISTVYAWAWCAAHMDMIKGNAGGSTFPEISKSVLRGLPMLRPSDAVLAAFETATAPLVSRMIAADEESATLAALRDALLPRLISGELRVRDAERAVAVA